MKDFRALAPNFILVDPSTLQIERHKKSPARGKTAAAVSDHCFPQPDLLFLVGERSANRVFVVDIEHTLKAERPLPVAA